MRPISRKTIVNANQCKQIIAHHWRRYRGIGCEKRALKSNALKVKALKVKALQRKGCHYSTIIAVAMITAGILSASLAAATGTRADQQAGKGANSNTSQQQFQVTNAKLYRLNLPEQTLASALNNLSIQTDIQVLFPFDIAKQHRINALKGRYSLQQTLEILLHNTDLYGGLTPSGVITIVSDDLNQNSKGKRNMKTLTSKRKTLLATLVGVFAAGGAVAVQGQDVEAATGQSRIDEIIVTANKRGPGQSLQDTAMSITAISGDTIAKRGLLDLSDFAPALPGVSLLDTGAGDKRVFIRGLASVSDLQTLVSTYLGEIPLSTVAQGSADIRLVDIERIEVLKGPQGTLYGSGSLSGTLRYIPVAPNLDTTEGSIEVDFATLAESDDTSESFTGVFNAPLIDGVLGLRAAAYHFEDAGYTDYVSNAAIQKFAADTGNQVRVEKDANSVTTTGIRASLLWDISDELNVNLTLGTQDQEGSGSNYSFDDVGVYQVLALDADDGFRSSDTDYAGLVVSYDLGWAELVSSSSLLSTNRIFFEGSYVFGDSASFGPTTAAYVDDTDSVTQEFRLSSQLEGPIQYLAGLYYEDVERERLQEFVWQGVPFTDTLGEYGTPGTEYGFTDNDGIGFGDTSFLDYQQLALFGELSYQLNDALELTVGARHFDYDREDVRVDAGGFYPSESPLVDSSQKGEIYKANLSFTPNDNTLLYLQWAEGFRLGRGQGLPDASACDVNNDGFLDHTGGRLEPDIGPDFTENVELGAKFTLLDNRLTLNATVYQMDWVDIPQVFFDTTDSCFNSITNNVGEVRSEGLELELNYLVTAALSVNLALTYNESEFTEVTDDAGVKVGEDLPHAPHSQANLGVEYSFDVSSYPAFIRTDINYIGEAESAVERNEFLTNGDYINVGLRAGISIDQWELALYGSNLLNENTAVFYNLSKPFGRDLSGRLTPRKLGLNVKYAF
ncbi:TonB-dependent receptor [bacterium]|nr:TonB-dependent receptor [bacterium]